MSVYKIVTPLLWKRKTYCTELPSDLTKEALDRYIEKGHILVFDEYKLPPEDAPPEDAPALPSLDWTKAALLDLAEARGLKLKASDKRKKETILDALYGGAE